MLPHVCVSQGHVTKENWCEQTTTGVGTAGDEECMSDGQTGVGGTWHMTLAYSTAVCSLSWCVCSRAEATSCLGGLPGTWTHVQLWQIVLRDASGENVSVVWRGRNSPRWHGTRSHRLGTCCNISVRKLSGFHTQCFASVSRCGRAQVRASFPCDERVSLFLSRAQVAQPSNGLCWKTEAPLLPVDILYKNFDLNLWIL
jgi:hypothetical protein